MKKWFLEVSESWIESSFFEITFIGIANVLVCDIKNSFFFTLFGLSINLPLIFIVDIVVVFPLHELHATALSLQVSFFGKQEVESLQSILHLRVCLINTFINFLLFTFLRRFYLLSGPMISMVASWSVSLTMLTFATAWTSYIHVAFWVSHYFKILLLVCLALTLSRTLMTWSFKFS